MNKFEYQNSKYETNPNDQILESSLTLLPRMTSFWQSARWRSAQNLFSNFKFCRGQALITLLFFVLISVTITSGAIIMIAVNSTSLGKLQEGTISYDAAEAGIENAILRVIRDPSYTGETLTIDTATVVITVTGSDPKTITAVGTNGNFKRTVQVQMTLTSGYYTLSGWREI